MKTYLSGPIFSVSKEEAAAWRNEAKAALEKMGIEAIIPRPFIPGEDVAGLVSDDMSDIQSSDFIISHIPPDTVMAGTPMEIFYAAYVLDIPVYTFPYNKSPWYLRWSTKSFATLEDLLEQLKKDFANGSELLQTVVE